MYYVQLLFGTEKMFHTYRKLRLIFFDSYTIDASNIWKKKE